MPVKEYHVVKGETYSDFVSRIVPIAGDRHGPFEVYTCFDALRIWDDVFRPKYGELLMLRNRYDGDDPPDVEACFEHGILDIEHTCIEPANRRHANILLKGDFRKVVPSSNKVKSVPGIIKASNPFPVDGGHDNLLDEACANFDRLIATMREKMTSSQRDRGLIVLESHSGLKCVSTVEPTRVAMQEIQKEKGWENFAFVVLARSNPLVYESSYMSVDHPFEIRELAPPPMTKEERLANLKSIYGEDIPEFFLRWEDRHH